MPIYEAICLKCGKYHDYASSLANRDNTPECCGENTKKVILSAPVGYCENIHYQSPIDGKAITTKQARIEDMRRNGCRPWEGLEQERKVAQQRAAEEEKQHDKKLEEAVVGAWHSLSGEQKKVLEAS